MTEERRPGTGDLVRATMVAPGEMGAALGATAFEFVHLLRTMPLDRAKAPVPGLDWTAADVGAHVITVAQRGLGDDRRAGTLEELAALNAACVAEVATRDPGELAELLQTVVMALGEHRSRPDDVMALHVGVVADRVTAGSYLLGDLLVHGLDVSRATGQPWTVDPARAATCLRGALPAMAPWVRPEIVAGPQRQLVLGFGDAGPPVLVAAGEGRYSAGPAPAPAEGVERTDADGAEVLLALTGRAAAADPAVARLARWFLPI